MFLYCSIVFAQNVKDSDAISSEAGNELFRARKSPEGNFIGFISLVFSPFLRISGPLGDSKVLNAAAPTPEIYALEPIIFI